MFWYDDELRVSSMRKQAVYFGCEWWISSEGSLLPVLGSIRDWMMGEQEG